MLNMDIMRFIFSGPGDSNTGMISQLQCTVRAHELPRVLLLPSPFEAFLYLLSGFLGVFLHNKCNLCCVLQSHFHSMHAGPATEREVAPSSLHFGLSL